MNELQQEKTVIGSDNMPTQLSWELNLKAAGRAQRWSQNDPALLAQEAMEMQQYFPTWLLTAVRDGKILNCASCGELMVWKPKGLVCVICDCEFKGKLRQAKLNLAWVGHVPAPVPQDGPLLERLWANPDPSAPLIKVSGQGYLLVPLLAYYPENWPQHAPMVSYDRAFLDRLGIKAAGHSTHLVGAEGTTMCLYSGWRAVTLRVVLQQRAVNHIVSLFKLVQGASTNEAFLEHLARNGR